MKEQKEKKERKNKKSYSLAKKNLVRGHSFMKFAKNVQNSDPYALPYPQISNFGLSSIPLLDVPNWHLILPGNLGKFCKSFNNEIKINSK